MKDKSTIALILSIASLSLMIFIFATTKSSANKDSKSQSKEATNETKRPLASAAQISKHYSPQIPDTLSFAGERVPLDIYYVREGLDREMIVNTFSHSSTILYFKRAHRYFPIIVPILKKNGIPSDFKYLCVIESSLTNATSPQKARGFWQFIKPTAQTYGLDVNEEIDMRNHLESATEAACKFLKVLHDHLGSWTAAAAAYNCGETGLSNNMNKQSSFNYYDTRLNPETARYVYRILAVKQIMQHPQEYGFYLRHCDLYPSLPYRVVTLTGQNVDLYAFAKKNGTSYKMLREFNPWIMTDKLTNKANKTYRLKLPVADGTLLRNIITERDTSKAFITRM